MKIKVFNILFVLLLLILTSCSNKSEIALFLYNGSDTFINSLSNTININLSTDYSITTYNAKSNQIKQNKQIIEAIDNNANYLIINPVNRLSCDFIINKAHDKNIPIIFFNREPICGEKWDDKEIYYVGSNSNLDGIYQANVANILLKDPKNLNKEIDKNSDNILQCIFIKGEAGHQDTERRTNSCINRLIELGYNLNILEIGYADWDKLKSKALIGDYYNKYQNNIEFIFANNDDMAIGACDYFIENKLYDNNMIPIVGVDGTSLGLEYIKNNYLAGSVVHDVDEQTSKISDLILYLEKKKSKDELTFDVDKRLILTSGNIVTKDNVYEYLI